MPPQQANPTQSSPQRTSADQPPRARPEPLILRRPPEAAGGRPRPQGAKQRTLLERGALRGIQELFKKEGIEFSESELPQLRLHKPDKAPFPILIFMMALGKDGLVDFPTVIGDLVGTTGIGLFITAFIRAFSFAFTFITTLTLLFWMWGKINMLMKLGIKFLTRRFVRWFITRFLTGVAVETIIPAIPFTVIFVILAHHRENKYVRLFLGAAEQLGKAIKGGKIKMPGA